MVVDIFLNQSYAMVSEQKNIQVSRLFDWPRQRTISMLEDKSYHGAFVVAVPNVACLAQQFGCFVPPLCSTNPSSWWL
jgi:hypothetical protein